MRIDVAVSEVAAAVDRARGRADGARRGRCSRCNGRANASTPIRARCVGIALQDLARATRRGSCAGRGSALSRRSSCRGTRDVARPYDISLGRPLADDPVVARRARVGSRSRTATSVAPRPPRCSARRSCRASGPSVRGASSHGCEDSRAPRDLGRRDVHAWRDSRRPSHRACATRAAGVVLARAQSPRDWVTQWRKLLDARGWPGAAPLAGASFEAQQAFDRAAGGLRARRPRRAAAAAARGARRAARCRVEDASSSRKAPPASDRDHGLARSGVGRRSTRCGSPECRRSSGRRRRARIRCCRVAWQRERSVPRSSAARELAFARAAHGATRSLRAERRHERARGDRRLSDAADRAGRRRMAGHDASAGARQRRRASRPRDRSSRCATNARRRCPRAKCAGGAGAIAAQSDCPFKAMAQYRLRVEPWPGAAEGLSPSERGQLVHAMMAAFWTVSKTHAALVALDAQALRERDAMRRRKRRCGRSRHRAGTRCRR